MSRKCSKMSLKRNKTYFKNIAQVNKAEINIWGRCLYNCLSTFPTKTKHISISLLTVIMHLLVGPCDKSQWGESALAVVHFRNTWSLWLYQSGLRLIISLLFTSRCPKKVVSARTAVKVSLNDVTTRRITSSGVSWLRNTYGIYKRHG